MEGLQAPFGEFPRQPAVGLDGRGVGAVIGDHHLHRPVSPGDRAAVPVGFAERQQALQAVAQLPGAVRHRDHHHEAVAFILSALGEQLLVFTKERLAGLQRLFASALLPEQPLCQIQHLAVELQRLLQVTGSERSGEPFPQGSCLR
ncbi:MAG: hypothetical protein DSZ00_09930 [Gammaproteobacteria bacterium]|nr:MAG: hypothetical protein DSZ00_09930 [Gammaproteobacteria bacterium]